MAELERAVCRVKATLKTAAGSGENQDRGAIIECSIGLVLVVADGAGGLSGGAAAADMAEEAVRQKGDELRDASGCVTLLEKMDEAICRERVAGEPTCALAVVTHGEVYGSSVGDSGVWVIREGGFTDLTKGQSRRPFIGSGSACPSPFAHKLAAGDSLLLATDGLLKYTGAERIVKVCRNPEPEGVSAQLIELVRYPSGALPDDVTVVFAYP